MIIEVGKVSVATKGTSPGQFEFGTSLDKRNP